MAPKQFTSQDREIDEATNDGLLSIEECKKYLGDENITDQEVKQLVAGLYAFVEKIFDKYG